MSDKPQKIIVAGGGTAGLITALILKKRLNVDVKVLAPKDIGIIGVGEGSTEHWADFLFFMQETASQSLIKTKVFLLADPSILRPKYFGKYKNRWLYTYYHNLILLGATRPQNRWLYTYNYNPS